MNQFSFAVFMDNGSTLFNFCKFSNLALIFFLTADSTQTWARIIHDAIRVIFSELAVFSSLHQELTTYNLQHYTVTARLQKRGSAAHDFI